MAVKEESKKYLQCEEQSVQLITPLSLHFSNL